MNFLLISYLLMALSLPSSPPLSEQTLSLRITPVIQEIKMKPGETKEISFGITNFTSQTLPLSLNNLFFVPTGDLGHIELRHQEKVPQGWIRFSGKNLPQDLNLDPREIKSVTLTLSPPPKTKEGDYYISLLFSAKNKIPETTSSSLYINQSVQIASLLFLSVAQNPLPKSIKVDQSITKIALKGPIPINLKVKNEGRSLVKVRGVIEIKNIFGKKVDQITLPSQIVLSQTSRLLKAQNNENLEWNPKGKLGLYSLNLTLYEKITGEKIKETANIFLLPFELIFIFSLITIILLARHFLKNHSFKHLFSWCFL